MPGVNSASLRIIVSSLKVQYWDRNYSYLLHLCLMSSGIHTQRHPCLQLYADWSVPGHSYGCPLFDTAAGRRQLFSPHAVGPSSITKRRQAVKPPPAVLAAHPSPHSFPSLPSPCCRLTYRPTCLTSPLLPNHYDTLTEWLRTGQVFSGREEVERK